LIETAIRILLTDFSVVMLVTAFVIAALMVLIHRGRKDHAFVEELFRWLLLLSLGFQGVYTFIIHVFFASYSAQNIGWAESPFQYEVGIADLTVGVLGLIAFWSNFSFRVAAATAGIVWYGGDAIGHVRQMIIANNYAPGNAGPWFWTDVLVPIVLAVCMFGIWKRQKAAAR
jgi:hypothetical protein